MHKILVIEDDIAVRNALAEILENTGYQVVTAEDGQRGLDVFRAERPDLVITDIVMPEKEGIETIREIRNECPNAKIVAISGGGRIGNTDYLKVARRLGASDAIAKPLDPDHLIAVVQHRLAAA